MPIQFEFAWAFKTTTNQKILYTFCFKIYFINRAKLKFQLTFYQLIEGENYIIA